MSPGGARPPFTLGFDDDPVERGPRIARSIEGPPNDRVVVLDGEREGMLGQIEGWRLAVARTGEALTARNLRLMPHLLPRGPLVAHAALTPRWYGRPACLAAAPSSAC